MPAVVISVVIVVPVVVMIETAMRAIPIAGIEAATFVTRANPICARVGRAGPVATMPDVAAIYGIPVTVHPKVAWSRAYRHYVVAWRGRRPDLNADGDLRSGVVSAQQEH
jgi:hypothetical protein